MPKASGGHRATHQKHTVLPEAETLVSVQALPRAVCFLQHEQAKEQRLQLNSDDDGVVRFHAKASKATQPIELHMECTGEDGKKTNFTIELRPDSRHALVKPNELRAATTGKLRPPLPGDPTELSNHELLKRSYPPRPDPEKAPARYARWLRSVSRPTTLVNPRLVPHPEVSFAGGKLRPQIFGPTLPLPPPIGRTLFNANSNIWSGAYITNPSAQFCHIQGDWSVPRVFALSDTLPYSAAAVWVGLDNGTNDLYQAGTDSELLNLALFGGWTITNYWIWIETFPFPPWGVPNFPVSPEDSVSVDIFVADENGQTWYQNGNWGGLTAADNSVWFMLSNHTQGLTYWGSLPTSPQTSGGVSSSGFTGSSAQFILERPSDSNLNPFPLAPFGIAGMQGCWYGDSQYGDDLWPLGANGSTPFVGNLTYLNMQDAYNLLDIAVSTPDSTTSDGYGIIWFFANSQ